MLFLMSCLFSLINYIVSFSLPFYLHNISTNNNHWFKNQQAFLWTGVLCFFFLSVTHFYSCVWLLSNQFEHPSHYSGQCPRDALEEDIPVWHSSSFHAIYSQISESHTDTRTACQTVQLDQKTPPPKNKKPGSLLDDGI